MRSQKNAGDGLWGKLRAAPIRLLPGPLATCIALLLGVSWALASAGPAAAVNTYTVFPCSGHTPVGFTTDISNIIPGTNRSNRFEINSSCGDPFAADHFVELKGFATLSFGLGDHALWKFEAPFNSEIKELAFDELFLGPLPGNPAPWDVSVNPFTTLQWRVFAARPGESSRAPEELGSTARNGRITAHSGPFRFLPGERGNIEEFPDRATRVSVGLECRGGDPTRCEEVPTVQTIAFTRNIRIVLTDFSRPVVGNPSGSLLAGGPVSGVRDLNFHASQTGGSGIFFGELLIDGQRAALIPANSNGGQCQIGVPFFTAVPCRTTDQTLSASIDTANLSEGQHQVQVLACNATSDPNANHLGDPACTALSAGNVIVGNAPVSKSPPTISGAPHPGSQLTATPGDWENLTTHPLAPFGFQWLRCPSEGQCAPIQGATGSTYTLTNADLGARAKVQVTATVQAPGQASASAPSAPTEVVNDQLTNKSAPTISGAAKVGAKLSASTGQWEDAAKSPISFAHQWLRCPSTVTSAAQVGQCEVIAGATATDYVAVKADAGKRLIAKVSASVSAPQALNQAAFSAPSDPVADNGGGGGGGGNPPETKIAKHPRKKTGLRKAKFTFSSDQAGSSFQCKLDKGPFKSCRSPFKRKVKPGRHVFRVRAVGSTGPDPTAAKFSWQVS